MAIRKTVPTRYVEMYHHIAQLEQDWDYADDRGQNTAGITKDLEFWRRLIDVIGARQRVMDVISRYDPKSETGLFCFRYLRQSVVEPQVLTVADKLLLEKALEEHRVADDLLVMELLSKIQTI